MQGPAREINPWVRDVATFQEKFEKKFDTSTNIGIAELIMHRLDCRFVKHLLQRA